MYINVYIKLLYIHIYYSVYRCYSLILATRVIYRHLVQGSLAERHLRHRLFNRD